MQQTIAVLQELAEFTKRDESIFEFVQSGNEMKNVMMSFSAMLCLLGTNVLLLGDEGKTTNAKPCITITGDNSRVLNSGYHRIVSIDDLAKVWQKHTGQNDVKYNNFDNEYDSFYNPLGLPLVDFDNYMVIAIFDGSSWNSAGLSAESVSEQEGRITFRFKDKPYQTAGPDGGGKKVSAYGFFVIPRSTKTVVVEEGVYSVKGEPPVWKERIKFEEIQEKKKQ